MKVGETYSDIADLLYGIAQGSILGSWLFNISDLYINMFEIEGFAGDHELVKQSLLPSEVKVLGEDKFFKMYF